MFLKNSNKTGTTFRPMAKEIQLFRFTYCSSMQTKKYEYYKRKWN